MKTLPSPSEAMLKSPQFEAVWQVIKGWDIEREYGEGYAQVNGSDVKVILDALEELNETSLSSGADSGI